jgi:hypothetical protein
VHDRETKISRASNPSVQDTAYPSSPNGSMYKLLPLRNLVDGGRIFDNSYTVPAWDHLRILPSPFYSDRNWKPAGMEVAEVCLSPGSYSGGDGLPAPVSAGRNGFRQRPSGMTLQRRVRRGDLWCSSSERAQALASLHATGHEKGPVWRREPSK